MRTKTFTPTSNGTTASHSGRRAGRTGAVALLLSLAVMLPAGCSTSPRPVTETREALGTAVSIAAYPADDVRVDTGDALDPAYAEMAGIEAVLNVHDPSSDISEAGEDPYAPHEMPAEALEVARAIEGLGVGEWFSPALSGVVALYGFESGGRVPDAEELRAQVALAAAAIVDAEERAWSFPRPEAPPASPSPGYDFGGAEKGLAIDRAAASLRAAGMQAGLITATSTTLTFGRKPDGGRWRIGVEDPRDPDEMVAVIEAETGVTVSTSGDYQRYFERDGVRYHHIIDPRTGEPAGGLRSLSVVGAGTALHSDILSTALFVAGPDVASEYARAHGLGLVLVDEAGEVAVVQPSATSGARILSP